MKRIIFGIMTLAATSLVFETSAVIPVKLNDNANLDFLALRFGFGYEYSFCPIKEIRNVPVSIRDVPVDPADIKEFSMDSSWSRPIGNANTSGPAEFALDLDLNAGPAMYFKKDGILTSIELGGGGDLCLAAGGNFQERNYLSGGRPTSGDSLSYHRGVGTALTWYGISSPLIRPYVFVKTRVLHESNPSISISVEYRVSYEDYTIDNGWDRNDSYSCHSRFNFATLVTGMPCLSVETSNVGFLNSHLLGFFGAEVGVKHVINYWSAEWVKQSDISFNKYAPVFSIFVRLIV